MQFGCNNGYDPETKEQSKERRHSSSSNLVSSRQGFSSQGGYYTHQKVAALHFEVLKCPGYSPDFAPLDYYSFPNLKKQIKGRNISTIEYATLPMDWRLCRTRKTIFLGWVKEIRTTES
jgi:hypothetical protein